jgi:acyl-coenzyme A synthetase/AMP-(fatty) acid ligase
VRDAALVPLDGSKDLLGAVVILRDAAEASGERERFVTGLREFLLERFERVVVPRHWRFVSRLPSDERGKLTAAALRTLFRKPHDAPAS